jgi:hypothetical protein
MNRSVNLPVGVACALAFTLSSLDESRAFMD